MKDCQSSYISLYRSGELRERAETAMDRLNSCELCARRCKADRLHGQTGHCRAPVDLTVSSVGPHFGEEAPLVGRNGSGTIFLTYCSLGCEFCQNYDISHLARGSRVSFEELAIQMVYLQSLGCHNINFVTPSHYLPQIIAALPAAIEAGLTLPIVWNCGGYENTESIKLLEGIVDIYMPDFKFAESEPASRYCNAPDYPEAIQTAILEMQRQVGDLKINSAGIAGSGLLIRHLVMPGLEENTRRVLEFIAGKVSRNAYVNIMDQYRPAYRADQYPEINRRITGREYRDALSYARSLGLRRGF